MSPRGIAVCLDRSNDRLVAAFAVALRERREAAGTTRKDLTERDDVSARLISSLETGRRQPSPIALSAISGGVGVSITRIVEDLKERLVNDRPDSFGSRNSSPQRRGTSPDRRRESLGAPASLPHPP